MAISDEDVAYDGPEVHEETADPQRPGITWLRSWFCDEPEPDEEPSDVMWIGALGVRCACQRSYTWLGWRDVDDCGQEAAARAELEAIADTHLIERHPQRSLFDGCGCR